jgi:eukaryotic-like serine/threonine-protein kinase
VVGETIGSYRVLSQLGAGAMGEVYLVEHRHLRRKSALKLLARELVARPDLIERIFLEARATSAIAHPGIVQVFDCEVDPQGRPYIVMEYLEGETVGALLARGGPLHALIVARLARSAADALEAAHGKGIVHRDIKPDNIFVASQPPDSVKIVDFGIAKLAGDSAGVHQTRSGALMGTPLYMSPEQCRDSARIDFRTDLYSLGCVMFEMLTGRPPFTHGDLGNLVVAHMTQPPPDARSVNPSVPANLAELIGDLLRKEPETRPASMREVANRLATFIASMTTVPGPNPTAATSAVAPAAQNTGANTNVRTTLGNTASEFVPAEHPKRVRVVVGAALVVALLVGGGVAITRRGGGEPAGPAGPAAPATSAAVAPPAPTTAPAAAPEPIPPAAIPAPAPEPAAAPAAPSAPVAAAGAAKTARAAPVPDLKGAWEGPWTDRANRQEGRLFLQVAGGGAVSGWMYNTSAHQSFRLTGNVTPAGRLRLDCDCPPAQGFAANGSLRSREAGGLEGEISLSTAAGVFGRSKLSLKRTTATH